LISKKGFNTAKGELVRTILYPKPSEFHFDSDIYKYVSGLAFISMIAMIFTVFIMYKRGESWITIILRTLDIITIAVPAALPGALTAGLIFAQNRLKKNKIYCISPNRINVCGSLDVFVFDKTGTLTEDDCDIKFILPVDLINNDNKQVLFTNELTCVSNLTKNNNNNRIIEIMSTCNSINKINGILSGDPLDLKLFEFTKWLFNDNNDQGLISVSSNENNSHQMSIIKQFPFSSNLQRMSIIAKCSLRSTYDFYSKGSPEMIASQCKSESLPRNFKQILNNYSLKGYRIIGLAYKELHDDNYLKLNEIKRDDLENEMNFLGLIIMENRLKKETTHVINRLNMANIRSIMCTGDNILTGLSVALECNILNKCANIVEIDLDDLNRPIFKNIYENNEKTSYIITGSTFDVLRLEGNQSLFDDLIENGAVFARMRPDQKQQLIEALQLKGHFVGMCGDGANDCGALKAGLHIIY
jgi:predicted P-type ATPase